MQFGQASHGVEITIDVDVSYGTVCVTGVLTYRLAAPWRYLWLVGTLVLIALSMGARRLSAIDQPRTVIDAEVAVSYLRDAGKLWASSAREQQRAFVREVFDRIVVDGAQVAAITPKPLYEPMFVLDRRERFGGRVGVVWLPGQDSNLQPID